MSDSDNEDFYTPGPPELYNVRTGISETSLKAAKVRLQSQYEKWSNYNEVDVIKHRRGLYSSIKANLSLQGSQIISKRFTSSVSFNQKTNNLAVGSWDGNCYIVDFKNEDFKQLSQLDHGDKVSDVAWNPDGSSIAVCGFNPNLSLFNIETSTKTSLSGHLNRVTKVKYHQDHPLLFSSSHDETWRMWDLTKQQELYYQEGHIGAVHSIDIHVDGSLLGSCGNDGVIKLWDLRTGQLIADLVKGGHVGAIHSMKFRGNGYQLVSGGVDHNVIAWDIRKTEKLTDLPLHKSVITAIEFTDDDLSLVTCSYDGNVVISECDSWKQIKKFESIDKVMDIACSGGNIVSAGWQGDVKLYNLNI